MSDDAGLATPELAGKPEGAQSVVLRNTLFLLIAQVCGMPLSLAVNAAMGRYLGAEEFGYIYLATTFASIGFLFVDFGQLATVPALVARNRKQAGELLGTGLAWNVVSVFAVYAVLAGGCRLAGYSMDVQAALALVVLATAIGTMTSTMQGTIRGFERTDIAAYGLVAQQLLVAAFVIPVLVLGGRFRSALLAQAAAFAVVGIFVWRALTTLRVGTPSVRTTTLRTLLRDGQPFVVLGLVSGLQPNLDALFLSRLSTPEAMGWLGAARKLVGVLVFPAASITSALYPTLCRLHVDDPKAFLRTLRDALRTATVLVVPIALGCALYPDLGISLFSRKGFAAAEDDLRVLSVFVFFLYFSMILGSGLAAAGQQRKWTVGQLGCVAISLIVDPLLVPWFGRRMGNGGLGVCVATSISEVLMVAVGGWLSPKGLFDRYLMRGIGLALVAGGAMAAAAKCLTGVNPFLAAPISVGAYWACLWLVGGIDAEQLRAIRGALSRKSSVQA